MAVATRVAGDLHSLMILMNSCTWASSEELAGVVTMRGVLAHGGGGGAVVVGTIA